MSLDSNLSKHVQSWPLTALTGPGVRQATKLQHHEAIRERGTSCIATLVFAKSGFLKRALGTDLPSGRVPSMLCKEYHYGRKRYIIGSETFSTCNQHVNFTFMNSPEFHACISYMGRYPLTCWGNDTHVWAMKKEMQIIFYM